RALLPLPFPTRRSSDLCLVQGQRLDQVGIGAEDAVDFPRCFTVGLHPRTQNQQIRTELERMARGHCRTYAVGARFVVAGSNDTATLSQPTYCNGSIRQTGIVTHLDGGVEAITVDMDDLAHA